MKKAIFALLLYSIATVASAQNVPKELWGKWIVRRKLPAHTISCWGDNDAKAIIGTEIEYAADFFRWKDRVTRNPTAEIRVVSARQFHDENSGQGTNSSQVTFTELGIKVPTAKQVTIKHPSANIAGDTTEIPGDVVLVEDPNTIVFSVCNLYFEAKRSTSVTHK
jgi:hypothetical protein